MSLKSLSSEDCVFTFGVDVLVEKKKKTTHNFYFKVTLPP